MKKYLSLLLLIFTAVHLTLAYTLYSPDSLSPELQRDDQSEWEDLGWAWRKRSSSFTKPFLRSMQLVKKNPDWHDLGWTWGRR